MFTNHPIVCTALATLCSIVVILIINNIIEISDYFRRMFYRIMMITSRATLYIIITITNNIDAVLYYFPGGSFKCWRLQNDNNKNNTSMLKKYTFFSFFFWWKKNIATHRRTYYVHSFGPRAIENNRMIDRRSHKEFGLV